MMAASMRYVSRINLGMITNNITRKLQLNSRTIVTEATAGLDDYKNARNTFAHKYRTASDTFKAKLNNSLRDESVLIFTEDLKALVHLVEKTPSDLDLLTTMLKKYCSRNTEIRFSSFKLGPIVMRAFHFLNEPHVALEAFKDPSYGDFFNQVTSYMVLLDLLFENGMYQEVIDTYDFIKREKMIENTHPKIVIPILALACYKKGTPESLEYSLKVVEDLSKKGTLPLRRVITILGMLALKLNKPHIALEILSISKTWDYISIRCLRLIAYADLDRIDDIVIEVKDALQRNDPNNNNYYIDVVERVNAAVQRNNVPDDHQIHHLLEMLKGKGYVSEYKLEDRITEPIDLMRRKEYLNKQGYEDQGWTNSAPTRFDRRDRNRYDQGPKGNWGEQKKRFY